VVGKNPVLNHNKINEVATCKNKEQKGTHVTSY
jgi:hypothetical protein